MASREPDEFGETEEETLHKKRARRVSFAETTAVHFFNRDDESEATPDAAKEDENSSNGKLQRTESEEIMELFHSDDEFDVGDDDSDVVVSSSFLRPVESPSSASCFGSATSNDEDNFFGPVSADFIRPGRLSDSAASEENHDVTMDSTAFSMHFRSLARSDSGAEFKTPTAVHGQFGETTPGQTSAAASPGDLMVLTGTRKRVSHSSSPAAKVTDSGNSDDMSLVGENPHSYDYGKIPPELDVLLAEGSKDVGDVAPTRQLEFSNSMSSARKENGCALDQNRCKLSNYTDNGGTDIFYIHHSSMISGEAISVDPVDIDKGNEDVTGAATDERIHDHHNDLNDNQGPKTPLSNHVHASVLQRKGMPFDKDEADWKVSAVAGGKFESPPSRASWPDLGHEQPLAGSISSLPAKHRQISMNSGDFQHAPLNSALPDKEFNNKRTTRHAWSTSVFAKSISRLKGLETFPFVSASKVEATAFRLLTNGCSIQSAENKNLEYASKDISSSCFDAPVVCLDAHFSNVAESDAKFRNRSNSCGSMNTTEVECASHGEVGKDAEVSGPIRLPSHKNSAEDVKVSSSIAYPDRGLVNDTSNNHESVLESIATETLHFMRSDCSSPEFTFGELEDSKETGRPGDFLFSPGNGGESKVSSSPLYKGNPITADLDHQGQCGTEIEATAAGLSSMDYSSSSDLNHAVDMCKERPMLKNQYGHRINFACSETALMDKVSISQKVVPSSDAVGTGRTLTTSSIVLSMHSTSLNSDVSLNELPVQVEQVSESPKEKPAFSLSLKEPRELSDDANLLLSVEEDDSASQKLMSRYNENVQTIQNSSSICGSDGPSSLKRKLFDRAKDHNDEILSLQRKPKLVKDLKQCEGHEMMSQSLGSLSAVRDIANVFTSFCGATKELLSLMTDKFDVPLECPFS